MSGGVRQAGRRAEEVGIRLAVPLFFEVQSLRVHDRAGDAARCRGETLERGKEAAEALAPDEIREEEGFNPRGAPA